jgi:segregation and condensation protein B
MTPSQILEALVFASPKPLSTAELVALLKAAPEGTENQFAVDVAQAVEEKILDWLEEVRVRYDQPESPFHLSEQSSGWAFVSHAAYYDWVRLLFPGPKPTRLSGPALETLAIIAYRQPVSRAEIEAVRGVAVDGVMQQLLDRSLVKITGRAEAPGRPLLYGTTDYFLQHFGLKHLDDLPNSDELRRVKLPQPKAPEVAEAPTPEPAPEPDSPVPADATTVDEPVSPPAQPSEPTNPLPDEPAPAAQETDVSHDAPGSPQED